MKRLLVVLSMLITMTGCEMYTPPPKPPPVDTSNPAQVRANITVERDNFKKMTTYEGPDITSPPPRNRSTVFIRAWKMENPHHTEYQVYASSITEGSWKHYSSANDSKGNNFKVTRVQSKVLDCRSYGGCTHQEDVGISVTKEYLEAAVKSGGMHFQIAGTAGKEEFRIPGGYIQGFLATVQ